MRGLREEPHGRTKAGRPAPGAPASPPAAQTLRASPAPTGAPTFANRTGRDAPIEEAHDTNRQRLSPKKDHGVRLRPGPVPHNGWRTARTLPPHRRTAHTCY